MKMLPLQDSRWDSQKSRHLVLEEKREEKKEKEKNQTSSTKQDFFFCIINDCREQLALTSAGQGGTR